VNWQDHGTAGSLGRTAGKIISSHQDLEGRKGGNFNRENGFQVRHEMDPQKGAYADEGQKDHSPFVSIGG